MLVDEWQFAALHSSLISGEWHGTEASVAVEAGDDLEGKVEQVAGELALLGAGSIGARIAFDLVLEEADEFKLIGPLAALSVEFPGQVVIKRPGRALALGPDLFLACDRLEVDCDSVQVSRSTSSEGANPDVEVVLEVGGEFESQASLSRSTPAAALHLRVPRSMILGFPWVNYRQELPAKNEAPSVRVERFLNMFMSLVRRHGHKGDAAVFDKKLKGRQSIKGVEFDRVLAVMERFGAVRLSGPMIHLTPEWEKHRFSGKSRDGVQVLADKMETWHPLLVAMTNALESK